jgi:methyltransferase
MIATAVLAVVTVLLLFEARRSRVNERALRARGAVEPSDDVYPIMQVVYPGCFVAMGVEGWLRSGHIGPWFWTGALVFAMGKGLKYWAVFTLGPLWTFRVLVPPGHPMLVRGPYRFFRHPNYLGIVGELLGVALMTSAPIAGACAVVGFGWIMSRRIRVEERALRSR